MTGMCDGIPVGCIMQWGLALSLIPSGWTICDGQNGTPDLRGRYLKGASSNPGTIGGSATHVHTAHSNHVVTQPSAHSSHVVTQPGAHSNHAVTQPSAHTFTQPSAHSAHVVTQPSVHSAHVVTQPSAHSAHAALATHAHELPFTKVAGGVGVFRMLASSIFGTGTSRAPESVSAAPTANVTAAAVALSQAVGGGTPDAHSAHAGSAVDAHSAHAGTAVDAHSVHAGGSVDAHAGSAVDAHSAHSGAAVDAHSAHAGSAVDAHTTHSSQSNEPPYYEAVFIMRIA